MKINKNFLDLEQNYLFSTVAKKQREFQAAHPEADIIKLSIGDVTKPLCPAVIEAMHKNSFRFTASYLLKMMQ